MNTDSITTDPRLTAHALGEMSHEELLAFEKERAGNPLIAAASSEVAGFCAVLQSALSIPLQGLADADRDRIIVEAGRPGQPGNVIRVRWIWGTTVAAACLAAGAFCIRELRPQQAQPLTTLAMEKSLPQVHFEDKPMPAEKDRELSRFKQGPSDAIAPPLARLAEVAQVADEPASKSTDDLAAVVPRPELAIREAKTVPEGRAMAPLAASPAKPLPYPLAIRDNNVNDSRRRLADEITELERLGADEAKSKSDFSRRGELSEESYARLPENAMTLVSKEPLSTFSVDVDTASYANVRRFLNQMQAPPPEAVRLEELVNYFPYDYSLPQEGRPFAVHVEMTSAPWAPLHRLARIALKGREVAIDKRPAANLVFLIDVSGSMNEPNKLPLVQQSLRFVVERLTADDHVSLVTYAGQSGVVLPATAGADKALIMAAIDGLGAGGSTNGASGIEMAYAQAQQHFQKKGINRVILATDGDFNVGVTSHEALLELITAKAMSGTFLTVLGYGIGNTKDDTMELLADKGNGNYAYIDSLSEARKSLANQFSGTLITIAKDVKLQLEFNPAVVGAYRLLGYENRMLAKQDFNDDKKDAGEIGAGHTVTALYELIPAGLTASMGAKVDPLKYQSNETAASVTETKITPAAKVSHETMTVKLRWKFPDGDKSELMEVPVHDTGTNIAAASAETRWAVAVAGFAARLRGHSISENLPWATIRQLAREAKGSDPAGYRGEFLQLIDKAESVKR